MITDASDFPSIVGEQIADPHEYLPPTGAEPESAVAAEIPTTEQEGEACSFDLVVALAAKGFVILAGTSGTGKSKSIMHLSHALGPFDPEQQKGLNAELVPVGADWTDVRKLLGYRNPFGKTRTNAAGQTNETYEITQTLRLLLRAADPDRSDTPHFLILDEMNLSHVERYFSTFLSLMEANRGETEEKVIHLLGATEMKTIAEVLKDQEPNQRQTEAAIKLDTIAQGLPLPANFFVVGTMNVDETTYMFSPKVLDRAHVLELTAISPHIYLADAPPLGSQAEQIEAKHAIEVLTWAIEQQRSRAWNEKPRELLEDIATELGLPNEDMEKLWTGIKVLLTGAFKLLEPVGFAFGFRPINEVFSYIVAWLKTRHVQAAGAASFYDGWQGAIDKVFLQKVLPRLHGNRRQLGDSLAALSAFIGGGDRTSTPPARYRLSDTEGVEIEPFEKLNLEVPPATQMKASRAKLDRMHRQLNATGYVTFIQ